ncbi:YciI family protein [Actinophytocola glycyrrhizae]|uniref:YciI family protein n=1 Tax=Actinophytocola glycyrrhizae TaxID=2044873 RepID=A0ABV9RS39_9PSEU
MKQYLLSIYQPEGTPEPDVLAPVLRELDALNQEMRDAGVWVFAGGLHPPGTATVVRAGDEEVLVTDGPFIEAKEFLGGFTVIRAADLDAALEWGRKLAVVLSPLAIEVRPFQ